jgi:hypothetical protein
MSMSGRPFCLLQGNNFDNMSYRRGEYETALDLSAGIGHLGLLAACSPGGAASGRVNCSYEGEVCVSLSTVKTFAMGDAVPITITVTSSKDISDLHLSLHTGAEITINGPQTWESGLTDRWFFRSLHPLILLSIQNGL